MLCKWRIVLIGQRSALSDYQEITLFLSLRAHANPSDRDTPLDLLCMSQEWTRL